WMSKIKPIVAHTPEQLASALGLSATDAREWQVQHALLKAPQRNRSPAEAHACSDRPSLRDLANEGDRHFERRSRSRLHGPADPHSRIARLSGEGVCRKVSGLAQQTTASPC